MTAALAIWLTPALLIFDRSLRCRHSVRLSLAIAAIRPVTAGVLIWEKVR